MEWAGVWIGVRCGVKAARQDSYPEFAIVAEVLPLTVLRVPTLLTTALPSQSQTHTEPH